MPQMGGAARKNQVRDLVLLVAVAVVPMALARPEAVGPYGVFAASSVLLAAISNFLVIRWAVRLVRLDLDRRAAAGLPKNLSLESLGAIFLALVTPIACLIIVLWAFEHWSDAVAWLRRWRVEILGSRWQITVNGGV